MTTPRVYRTNAVILRHIRIGEADRILTLCTPYLGKLRVVAKGVLKPTSRKAGHLDLLSHTSLLIARGRNLDIVTQAQVIDSFDPLRQDVMRISRALYAAELADRFTDEGAESRQVYELLLTTLNWLCNPPETDEGDVALRYLEMQILVHSGYRPELRHCVRCRVLLSPTANFFSAAMGGVLCPSCGQDMDGSTGLTTDGATEPVLSRVEGLTTGARPLSLNALKVLRLLQGADPSTRLSAYAVRARTPLRSESPQSGQVGEADSAHGVRSVPRVRRADKADTTSPGMAQRLRLEPPLDREVEGHLRHYLTYTLERDMKATAFLDHLRGSTGRRQAVRPSVPAVGYQGPVA